jgi:hypothetical protein
MDALVQQMSATLTRERTGSRYTVTVTVPHNSSLQ